MKVESKIAIIGWLAVTGVIHCRYESLFITVVFALIPVFYGILWVIQNRMDGLPWWYNLE